MFDPRSAGRISETTFKACLGIFLCLSVLVAAARTVIRIRIYHRLHVDDVFLFFGLICMCIATGLVYSVISGFYLQGAAEFDPEQYKLPLDDMPKLLMGLKIIDVFVVFAWTAEFSVKLSLLLFFRRLVDRLPRLMLYVKFVMGSTTVVWAVLVCEPFILCPHFGLAAISECIPPTNVQLTIALTVFIIVLDILTDIMIISIPLCVIWKASMSIKQKLGLGAFLTMNIWLITIALVRVTSFKQGMTFDLIWTLFFQFLEPNIAILAACFSAFRSIFVTNGSEARGKRDRPSHSLRKIFRKTPSDHRPLDGLPTVTGATLTGLRTALGNVTNTSNRDSTLNPIGDRSERDFADSSGRIHVKHDWSLDSTRVAPSPDELSGREFV